MQINMMSDETIYTSSGAIVGTLCGHCSQWKRDIYVGAWRMFVAKNEFCSCAEEHDTEPRIPLHISLESL